MFGPASTIPAARQIDRFARGSSAQYPDIHWNPPRSFPVSGTIHDRRHDAPHTADPQESLRSSSRPVSGIHATFAPSGLWSAALPRLRRRSLRHDRARLRIEADGFREGFVHRTARLDLHSSCTSGGRSCAATIVHRPKPAPAMNSPAANRDTMETYFVHVRTREWTSRTGRSSSRIRQSMEPVGLRTEHALALWRCSSVLDGEALSGGLGGTRSNTPENPDPMHGRSWPLRGLPSARTPASAVASSYQSFLPARHTTTCRFVHPQSDDVLRSVAG